MTETKQLDDFILKESKYWFVKDGECLTAIYGGYKVVPNTKDPEKNTVRYEFTKDGYTKFLGSSSIKLARLMRHVKIGSLIKLCRTGEREKTNYTVEVIKESE